MISTRLPWVDKVQDFAELSAGLCSQSMLMHSSDITRQGSETIEHIADTFENCGVQCCLFLVTYQSGLARKRRSGIFIEMYI